MTTPPNPANPTPLSAEIEEPEMPDFPGFTVDVEGSKTLDGVKYDFIVRDINGNQLCRSHQNYENRQFCEWIAIRLFGAPNVIAQHLGIDPPELREAESAILNVWGANGALDSRIELR